MVCLSVVAQSDGVFIIATDDAKYNSDGLAEAGGRGAERTSFDE